jgi:ribosomal protein S18 acetylase RimI-like enzyme
VLLGPGIHRGEPLKASLAFFEIFNSPAAASVPVSEAEGAERTILYAVNAVYVIPVARGHGVGKQLMQAVLESAKLDYASQGPGVSKGICVVFVEKTNTAARSLNESVGFEVVSEDDYVGFAGRTGTALTLIKSLDD